MNSWLCVPVHTKNGKYDNCPKECSIRCQYVIQISSSSAGNEGCEKVGEGCESTTDMAQRMKELVVNELFEKLKKIISSGSSRCRVIVREGHS